MTAMQWNVKRMIRVFFIFLYVLYAFTPVHMYALAGGGGTRGLLHSGKHASSDIVWANVLYSVLVDDDDIPPAGVGISPDALPDDDVVLVRKRRVVLRQYVPAKPFFYETTILSPAGTEQGVPLSREYELTRQPAYLNDDGYLALNTGLSPPVFFR